MSRSSIPKAAFHAESAPIVSSASDIVTWTAVEEIVRAETIVGGTPSAARTARVATAGGEPVSSLVSIVPEYVT